MGFQPHREEQKKELRSPRPESAGGVGRVEEESSIIMVALGRTTMSMRGKRIIQGSRPQLSQSSSSSSRGLWGKRRPGKVQARQTVARRATSSRDQDNQQDQDQGFSLDFNEEVLEERRERQRQSRQILEEGDQDTKQNDAGASTTTTTTVPPTTTSTSTTTTSTSTSTTTTTTTTEP